MDKNDAVDWQAYYHLRNRVITALLHSQLSRGGRLVSESAERQLQNLLSMQYSTAALRLLAIEDVLAGPARLHPEMPTKMAQLQELRNGYSDAQSKADVESFPPARRRPPEYDPPTNKIGLLRRLIVGVLHQLRPVRKGAKARPQVALPHVDSPWYVLVKLDSVAGVDARRREHLVVPARPAAAVLARLAQHDPARAAVAELAAAGPAVPRGAGRLHLTRAVARDVHRVPGRPARRAVSSMAAGQGGKTSAPPTGPGSGPRRGPGAAEPGAGAVPSRWTAAAVRYGPPGIAAATMAVLGVWGLARHGSMGNDEVATRWAGAAPAARACPPGQQRRRRARPVLPDHARLGGAGQQPRACCASPRCSR